jgi:4-oxalocrotonate tautomerase
MPVIQVDMFSGRTMEKKRELVKALTDAFVSVTGAKAEAVHVILRDIEKHDWGVAGSLCSDAQAPAGAAPATRPERAQ